MDAKKGVQVLKHLKSKKINTSMVDAQLDASMQPRYQILYFQEMKRKEN